MQLRSATYHTFIYKRMVQSASMDAELGSLVSVYDKLGHFFGTAFFNPESQIALRLVSTRDEEVDAVFFERLLERAVALRRDVLQVDRDTNAYRLVNSEGDELSGLVVDLFDDVLSIELFSAGAFKRLGAWLPFLQRLTGTEKYRVHVDPTVTRREAIRTPLPVAPLAPTSLKAVRIREHGVRYAVDLASGHKTGFFCDQRQNRVDVSRLVSSRSLLDVCCYSGGFGISALVGGGTQDVTGVDLDERAIDQAKHNANLNQVRAKWVHADAFSYLRQMHEGGKRWEMVVLDPPKFIPTRRDYDEGEKKYHDLNRLAVSVVAPGGLFVTCSCSGLMPPNEFDRLVCQAAHRAGRRLQIFRRTEAGPDHPVLSNCPEGRYLQVTWCRVL